MTSRGYLNGDGFGLGWYPEIRQAESGHTTHGRDAAKTVTTAADAAPREAPREAAREPCVFTSTGPAWNDTNLAQLARSIRSPLVFAHVRAATLGSRVCQCSCHPFSYGRFLWMHNGQIGGFHRVRRRLLASLGQTTFDYAVSKVRCVRLCTFSPD